MVAGSPAPLTATSAIWKGYYLNDITPEHLFCIERRDCKRTCCGSLIDEVSTLVAIDGPSLDVHACPEVVSFMASAFHKTNGKSKDDPLDIQKLCPVSSR